jgi:hypothetical protein
MMNRQTVGSDRIYQQAMMDQQQQMGVAPVPPNFLMPVNTRESRKVDQEMIMENNNNNNNNFVNNANNYNPARVSQFQRMMQVSQQAAVPSFTPRQQQSQFVPQQQASVSQGAAQHFNKSSATGDSQWGFTTRIGVNPFDVLGLPRNTSDESVVDDAFRRWAMVLHPDRGGDPKKLEEISAAYEKVKEIFMHAKHESFELLKSRAEHDLSNMHKVNGGFTTGTQTAMANPSLAPLGNGRQFDNKTFNTVFQNHRMWNPHDDGYGSQMVQSQYQGQPGQTLDQLMMQRNNDDLSRIQMVSGYEQLLHQPNNQQYTELYNNMFQRHILSDQYKEQQLKQLQGTRSHNTGMVVYGEPESADNMFRSSTSLCTSLSVDKIDDFSSPFNGGAGAGTGGAYTDYMKAFSTDSLITPHVYNAKGNGIMTVEQLERERAQLSHIPSAEVLRERTLREAREKEADQERWRRYQNHLEQIEQHNAAIRNLLPERSVTHPKK